MEGATNKRGGRRKRIYHLSIAGKAAIKAAKSQRTNLWEQVPNYALEMAYAK
jgi:DNA-binding PadR family transcriptional regulator